MRSRRNRRGAGRATLRDVADHAGVAMMTVSRALNAPETVSESLRGRIRASIMEMGYVQNRFAGGLASTKSQLITVIVPALSSRVFAEVVHAASEVFSPRGYQILVSNTSYSLEDEEEACRRVLSWRPDGIIVSGVDHSVATRQMLKDAGVPVVEALEIGADPIDINVGISHVEAGRCAGRYLVGLGRRKIGIIGAQMEADFRASRRLAGFRDELAKAGQTPVALSLREEPSTFEVGALGLSELMATHREFDAIFGVNDELAVGALLEAQRRGIKVPDQLAIMGFNDLDISSQINPSLTTIRSQRRRMGQVAAQAILDRLDGKKGPTGPVDLGVELMKRESA